MRLSGTQKTPVGSLGLGSGAGRQGAREVPLPPAQHSPSRGGGADGVGSGARSGSLPSQTPRVASAPQLKLYKE